MRSRCFGIWLGWSCSLPVPQQLSPPPSLTALAYDLASQRLAVGGYGEVIVLERSGAVQARHGELHGAVTALAYAPNGESLAIACGGAKQAGELRSLGANAWQQRPHQDAIYALQYSPDGKLLASGSYDRTVRLSDAKTGELVRLLKDHSDSVYGLAFSPDGTLLASVAADRAVKIWDVATGKRLYTLGEATDWLYAVAFSPDGKQLVAGSVDKSLRIWLIGAKEGKLLRSSFAHEGSITHVAWSADGSTIYSLASDRVAKAWDAKTLVERRVYPAQPTAVHAFALRPDGRELAFARQDGRLILLDPSTGKVTSEPLPAKPKPPSVRSLQPAFAPRGSTVRAVFSGEQLDAVSGIACSAPGIQIRLLEKHTQRIEVELTITADSPIETVALLLASPTGPLRSDFTVDRFPRIGEKDATAPALNRTIAGRIAKPGETNRYQFHLRAGQEVGAHITTAMGTMFEAAMQWSDATGRSLAEGGASIAFVAPAEGTFALSVRDREYRGNANYLLHVGEVPVVTGVYPLGIQRGQSRRLEVFGVHLRGANPVTVVAKSDAMPGSKVSAEVKTALGKPVGDPQLTVGEWPEPALEDRSLLVPGTGNGRIATAGQVDTWRFAARRGEPVILEVAARRLGSPLDGWIEIVDARGQPIPRATLRAVAKTTMNFRDVDSAGSGIRLESCTDFGVDDYFLVDGEVIRMAALPKSADDDARFYAVGNQRTAYLGTDPTFHAQGSSVYKIQIHPASARFAPNGLPLVNLYYRNDDGGAGFGKDPRLTFDPPADGEYQVRIGDSRGQGSPLHAYRLTIRKPRPDFSLSLKPNAPTVWAGGTLPLEVTVDRIDGFTGPIELSLGNLGDGFTGSSGRIDAEQTSTTLGISATTTAKNAESSLQLIGRATMGGQTVERTAMGGKPTVVPLADLRVRVLDAAVQIQPGGEATFTVEIERLGGFNGRVPLELKGLPHGVRPQNIGLNGILITERETRRKVTIYAEPWTLPGSVPILVTAKREGKGGEYAAPPLPLSVK